MEIERAIITSLNEPRNYTELFLTTTKLRKEHKLGLSKEDFNDALKRLENEKIIKKEHINKREVRISRNMSTVGQQREKILLILGEEDSKINKMQEMIQAIEEEITYITENKIKNKKKRIQKILELITNSLLLLLNREKAIVFLSNTAWSFPFTKKEIIYQQKKCRELIKRLSFAAEKLDKGGSATILLTIFREIQHEIDKDVKQISNTARYFQNKNRYE